MAARDIVTALGVADFRWLWLGSLASSFAMNMQIIARGWLVYTLTASAMDLGWVTLSFMLPTVVLSLWGGVLADRMHKRRVIWIAQTLNGATTLVMAGIILTGRIEFWHFIVFGFFNGAVLALSMPARQAFVPEVVPERLIFTGMALNTTGWNLSRILGPAIAGYLIAWIAGGDTGSHYGVGILYVIIAALYLVSAVTMLLVSVPGRLKAPDGKSPLRDVAEGLNYVRHSPPVLGLILLSIVPFLFGMPINTMLPAFNEDVLRGGADQLGLLMSNMGVGAIIGSLMMAAMGGLKRKAFWLIATSIAWGAATVWFAQTLTALAASLALMVVGWLSAWNMSLNRGLLQMQTTPEMRGRILSIDMMSHGLMPLGVLPIAWIAEVRDVATALAVSGLLLMLSVAALTLMRAVRRVDAGMLDTTTPADDADDRRRSGPDDR